MRSLLDSGSKSHGATRGDLAHEVRQGLKADFERLERFFDDEFDRDGAHGLAVFVGRASTTSGARSRCPMPVSDTIRVADDFLLAPLVPLVGRGEGALVVVVNREAGRLCALRGGRLEEIADRTEDAPRRHDQGGWSQARLQRHVDNLAHEHYKSVAEELERRFRRLQRPRVVVVCSEDVRPEFAEVLSTEVEHAIIGWATAEQHAGPAELQEVVVPLLESWRAEREAELVERWREEAGRNGRAAAAGPRRSRRPRTPASRCSSTHDGVSARRLPLSRLRPRVRGSPATCPLDGTRMEPRDDGLDLAVRLTLANGGEVLGGRATGATSSPSRASARCCASRSRRRLRGVECAMARSSSSPSRLSSASSSTACSSRASNRSSQRCDSPYFPCALPMCLPIDVEVALEAREVLRELTAVRHHLLRVLLDLQAAEADHDHRQVRVERRRRDREDAALERVALELAGAAARDLVVDGLCGEVHEREVVRALGRLDVLRRDRVDVHFTSRASARCARTRCSSSSASITRWTLSSGNFASTGSSFSTRTTASTRSPLAKPYWRA